MYYIPYNIMFLLALPYIKNTKNTLSLCTPLHVNFFTCTVKIKTYKALF